MKPTLEQVQEWRAMAYRYADKQTGDYNEADEIAQEKFAELAAQWGAERAQQTTDPLGFQIRRAIAAEDELRATKQTLEHAYAALQKVADAQAAIEEPELPEAVAYRTRFHYPEDAPSGEYRVGNWRYAESLAAIPKGTVTEALHTAAHLHDHFAAGVRAGMAQSQDGLSQVISGAIFDFAGFLTTRPNVIEEGSK